MEKDDYFFNPKNVRANCRIVSAISSVIPPRQRVIEVAHIKPSPL
jgi:hypothetical protein